MLKVLTCQLHFIKAIVPRAEVYLILPLKYQHDCMYIRQCEDALIGQAVVCRDNKTGVFHLGAVRDRVKGPRNYLIEWADQNLDIQVCNAMGVYFSTFLRSI